MQYVIVSIHPTNFLVTPRSYHADRQTALSALKDEVSNFVTNYKRYQTVMYINNLDEVVNHPKIKFFLRIPDEMPDRIEVYESVKKINRGYLYNSSFYHPVLIKIFDVISSNIPTTVGTNQPDQNDRTWTDRLNQKTTETNQNNQKQVAVMEELAKALQKHRKRHNYD